MKTRAPLISSVALRLLAAAAIVSAVACSASKNTTSPTGSGGDGSGGGNTGGSDTGGDELAGGSSGTGTITESCGASTYASQVPGSVLVVLDKSGSMSGGDGQPDKWGPTVQAIKTMMASAGPDLGMGLLPFPSGNYSEEPPFACVFEGFDSPGCIAYFADGGCEDVVDMPTVAVAPLSQSAPQISAWLDSNSPGGNTPTLMALKRAYAYMAMFDAPGERFVLLITDGVPTQHTPPMPPIPEANLKCGTLADMEAETLAAATGTPKLRTFVIGSPGSEGAADFLSQIAINGETQKSAGCSAAAGDCHYQIGQANFQQELEAALADISGKVSECVFEIPDGEDADPDYVNVELESSGMKTPVYKDTAHQDGWDYTDDTHTKVELFGPACEKFKAETGAKVSIILGCKTIVK